MALRVALVTASLLLTSLSAAAEIYKCRQGEGVIYQERPCPVGSQSLPPPLPAAAPNAFAVEQARAQARSDIASAEALRKAEEKAEQLAEKKAEELARQAARAEEAQRSEVRKQETGCARLRAKIEKVEARIRSSRGKAGKTLQRDRRQYQKTCAAR